MILSVPDRESSAEAVPRRIRKDGSEYRLVKNRRSPQMPATMQGKNFKQSYYLIFKSSHLSCTKQHIPNIVKLPFEKTASTDKKLFILSQNYITEHFYLQILLQI